MLLWIVCFWIDVDVILRWVSQPVSQVPQKAPITIYPDVPVSTAVDIMKSEGFDQIPVVSKTGFVAHFPIAFPFSVALVL